MTSALRASGSASSMVPLFFGKGPRVEVRFADLLGAPREELLHRRAASFRHVRERDGVDVIRPSREKVAPIADVWPHGRRHAGQPLTGRWRQGWRRGKWAVFHRTERRQSPEALDVRPKQLAKCVPVAPVQTQNSSMSLRSPCGSPDAACRRLCRAVAFGNCGARVRKSAQSASKASRRTVASKGPHSPSTPDMRAACWNAAKYWGSVPSSSARSSSRGRSGFDRRVSRRRTALSSPVPLARRLPRARAPPYPAQKCSRGSRTVANRNVLRRPVAAPASAGAKKGLPPANPHARPNSRRLSREADTHRLARSLPDVDVLPGRGRRVQRHDCGSRPVTKSTVSQVV